MAANQQFSNSIKCHDAQVRELKILYTYEQEITTQSACGNNIYQYLLFGKWHTFLNLVAVVGMKWPSQPISTIARSTKNPAC